MSSNKKDPDRYDLCSPNFDPVRSLHCPELVRVPCPRAPTYDNIWCFEETPDGIFPKVGKKRVEKPKPIAEKAHSSDITPELTAAHQVTEETGKQKKNIKNVITRMENDIKGPLSFVKNCMTQKLRVKICTRSAVTIRGFCCGFIEAFDKHWNMVLKDVFETWTRKRKKKTPFLGPIVGPRSEEVRETSGVPICGTSSTKLYIDKPRILVKQQFKRKEICERHIDQLLIRGEQIVYVTLAS